MPNNASYADTLHDWEVLISAALDNAASLTIAEPQRVALEQSLVQVRDLKARQASHAATSQQMTQDLAALIDNGREQARRLRGLAKGLLGTRNERLVQFNVAPLRHHPRAKQTPPATPPVATPPATQPAK